MNLKIWIMNKIFSPLLFEVAILNIFGIVARIVSEFFNVPIFQEMLGYRFFWASPCS